MNQWKKIPIGPFHVPGGVFSNSLDYPLLSFSIHVQLYFVMLHIVFIVT